MPRKATPKPRQWGDGSVSQRPNGTWQGALSLGRGPDGRYRREYVYAATEAEAEVALARLRRQRQRGELTAKPDRVRLGDLLDRWLDRQRERVAAGRLSAGTLVTYTGQIDRHIRPQLGNAYLAEVTPVAVEDWLATLTRRDLSAAYIRCVRSLLRQILEYAVDLELLSRNPARRVDGPPGKPATPRTPYTVEETRAFLEAATGHRLGALCWILAYTGLRRGEARGLAWADLDMDTGLLRVSGQYQWQDGRWERRAPKTRAGVRAIPLPADLVELLRRRKADQRRERLRAKGWAESDLIFTTRTGAPLHANSITQVLVSVCRAAGIPYKSPHYFRHGIATLLGTLRVPPRVAQAILGHANAAVTLGYQHSDTTQERAALGEIERAIRGAIC